MKALLVFCLAAPILSLAQTQQSDPAYFDAASSSTQAAPAQAISQGASPTEAPISASASPAPTTAQPLNITYQPARCGPWYGNAPCPPDAQNRQLFCSQWGYCGWEFQPQEQAGRFLNPDFVCAIDKECENAVANSGLKGVICSPAEHKCLINLNSQAATSTPTKTVSGGQTGQPAAFMLCMLLALAVFV